MTKFFIEQHGCAKNQTDGELIVGFLVQNGFEHTTEPSEAKFIIVNSCGFIQSAKKESIDAVYSIHAEYPNAKLILTGCLAERYADLMFDSMPELNGVFGNGDLSKIVDFMKKIEQGDRLVQTFKQEGICAGERPVLFNFKGSAYVKITEGCSNHCTFCAIPLIRGEVRSRKPESIIKEIKSLINQGIYEINLIGQDLAAFGCGASDEKYDTNGLSPLAYLLSEISKLEGDFIVRPLYIHPDHFNKDILEVMKKDERLLPYFDIPFQSGDDIIIKKMNRTGTSAGYKSLVENIRKELPATVLRTTFLAGFPGETEEAAKNTLDFLRTINPDWSGCFPYSREEDTPAYNMKPRVPAKTAQKRAAALEELQSQLTQENLKRYVGIETPVLIEEIIEVDSENTEDLSEGLAIGRAWFQAPDVDGNMVIRYDRDDPQQVHDMKNGNVVNVKVLAVSGIDLDSRYISLKREYCKK